MCLVESKGAPKPVASCAFPAMPGQVISTTSPLVAKAREVSTSRKIGRKKARALIGRSSIQAKGKADSSFPMI